MNRVSLIAVVILVVFLISLGLAGIPQLISYQGMLTTPGGSPVSDGEYDLTFKIYGSISGSDSLWWEHHTDVNVTNGLFNVLLGSISSLSSSVFEDSVRYLGIKVGTDPELTPRTRLTSVPFAHRAGTSETDGDWTISGSNVYRTDGNVGIGTITPQEKLDVFGIVNMSGFKMSAGASNGYVLTSNASGVGTWQAASTGIGGSGTANYLSKFTSSNTLGNSMLYETGGKIGIGTTSPTTLLELKGTDAQLTLNTTSALAGLNIQQNGSAKWNFAWNSGSKYLYFYNFSGTPGTRMVIQDSTGNVGIGTISPQEKLDVSGIIKMSGFKMSSGASNSYVLTSDASGLGTWQAAPGGIGGSGTANYIPKFTATATLGNSAIYETGGKVGIGLSNPSKKLHLSEDAALSYPLKLDNPNANVGSGPGILFSAGGDGSTRGKGGLVYELTSTWNRGSFHFLQDANANLDNPTFSDAVMTIRNDGKVGIGTTGPSYKLDVRGDRIQLKEDATGHWIAMRTDGTVLDFSFSGAHLYFQGNADGEHIFLNPSRNSNVGVGTITPTARLHAVGGDYGVKGKGSIAGGYFEDSGVDNYVYLGYRTRGRGIHAIGDSIGGAFGTDLSGFAYCGYYGTGIQAKGDVSGGNFVDLSSGMDVDVAWSTYKVLGSGSNSFVQNHPHEADKVIVYTSPEGDETATYTRGTAKLSGGEARVPLGETFKWVTNPEIGLTAHLTPRGDCEGLYVASLTTDEMVVRELRGGTSEVVFDYLVYGLRIGFEEISVVQAKRKEAYIPSMSDHRQTYNTYPQLRHYNALERFKRMNAEIGRSSSETGEAKALLNAIHEFGPTIDRSVTSDQF